MLNLLVGPIFSHPLVIGLIVILVGALVVLDRQHNTGS